MLIDRVTAVLDRRLERDLGNPVAVALSGGGDSVALLHLATIWAARRGRRVVALTVNHGLNSDSECWSDTAAAMAGVEWRNLVWSADQTTETSSALARAARHRLIAQSSRDAGACVVLMAHTADDRAEAGWMRDQGSTVGTPREWSPSPAWPEGRDLMILRPLLDVSRAELRAWLLHHGQTWIEDPANTRIGSLRAKARRLLAGRQPAPSQDAPRAPIDFSVVPGGVVAPVSTVWLGPILTSVSGGAYPPRSDRVNALLDRLRTGDVVTATLGGATVVRDGETLRVAREPGRRRPAPTPLGDKAGVWDRRFELSTPEPGWRVAAAQGYRARLSDRDRARLNALPAISRAMHPVLFRGDDTRPVLADEVVMMRDLVPDRLRLATDGVRREADLFPSAMALAPVASYL